MSGATASVALAASDRSSVLELVDRAAQAISGLTVIAHVSSGEEVLEICREAKPELLVLDAALPGPDPLAVMERVTALGHGTRVVVLFREGVWADVPHRALAAGAAASLLLSDQLDQASFISIVHAVLGGLLVVRREPLPTRPHDPGTTAEEVHLSRREVEVLRLASNGKRTKQIAQQLGIGKETVETTMHRAVEKLGAQTRTHAVAEAIRSGIL